MAEPAKVNFNSTKQEEVKLPEMASGITFQEPYPFFCCGPIVIDPTEVRWANMDTANDQGEGGVLVQFKDDNEPIFFKGLDGMRVIKILQDAGKDVPDA